MLLRSVLHASFILNVNLISMHILIQDFELMETSKSKKKTPKRKGRKSGGKKAAESGQSGEDNNEVSDDNEEGEVTVKKKPKKTPVKRKSTAKVKKGRCKWIIWTKVESFVTLERDNLTHPHPPQLTKIGTMSELIPLFLITRDVFNRVRDELLLLDNICLLKSGNRYSFLVSILICFLPNWPKKFKFDLFENWSDDFAGGGLNSSNVCLLWAYHCLVYVRERIHRRSEESWQQSCVQRQWTQ